MNKGGTARYDSCPFVLIQGQEFFCGLLYRRYICREKMNARNNILVEKGEEKQWEFTKNYKPVA